jgi:hypothetical protein
LRRFPLLLLLLLLVLLLLLLLRLGLMRFAAKMIGE